MSINAMLATWPCFEVLHMKPNQRPRNEVLVRARLHEKRMRRGG